MSRVTATDRLQRILAVVPWILQNQGATVDEICQRFGVERDDLIADLEFVFYNVGLHPFTPDMLAEVTFDDDRVTVHIGDYFRRPLRLTHSEALTLVAAGRALAGRPGVDPDGTLDRAVRKVAAVLGAEDAGAIEVGLGEADPVVFEAVRSAVDGQRQLTIEYYSYGRDEPSIRRIEPYAVHSNEGRWYLNAFCQVAGAQRSFRVDRIRAATVEVETFDRPVDVGPARITLDGARTVELTVDEGAAWVTEQFPVNEVESLEDGRLRIVLPVTADAWLQRLLLQLGPSAEAIDLDEQVALHHEATAAAQRILTRYRNGDDHV